MKLFQRCMIFILFFILMITIIQSKPSDVKKIKMLTFSSKVKDMSRPDIENYYLGIGKKPEDVIKLEFRARNFNPPKKVPRLSKSECNRKTPFNALTSWFNSLRTIDRDWAIENIIPRERDHFSRIRWKANAVIAQCYSDTKHEKGYLTLLALGKIENVLIAFVKHSKISSFVKGKKMVSSFGPAIVYLIKSDGEYFVTTLFKFADRKKLNDYYNLVIPAYNRGVELKTIVREIRPSEKNTLDKDIKSSFNVVFSRKPADFYPSEKKFFKSKGYNENEDISVKLDGEVMNPPMKLSPLKPDKDISSTPLKALRNYFYSLNNRDLKGAVNGRYFENKALEDSFQSQFTANRFPKSLKNIELFAFVKYKGTAIAFVKYQEHTVMNGKIGVHGSEVNEVLIFKQFSGEYKNYSGRFDLKDVEGLATRIYLNVIIPSWQMNGSLEVEK